MAGGIVVDPDTPVVNINTNNDNTSNVESDFGGEFVPGGGEEEGTDFGARTGGESDFGAEFVPGGGEEEGTDFTSGGAGARVGDGVGETESQFGAEFVPGGGEEEGTDFSAPITGEGDNVFIFDNGNNEAGTELGTAGSVTGSQFGNEFVPGGGEEEGIVFSGDGLTSDSRVETGSEFGYEFVPNGGGLGTQDKDCKVACSVSLSANECRFPVAATATPISAACRTVTESRRPGATELLPSLGGRRIPNPDDGRVDNANGQEDDGGRVEKRQGQNDPVIVVVTATATDKVTATAETDVTATATATATATVKARFRGVRDYVL